MVLSNYELGIEFNGLNKEKYSFITSQFFKNQGYESISTCKDYNYFFLKGTDEGVVILYLTKESLDKHLDSKIVFFAKEQSKTLSIASELEDILRKNKLSIVKKHSNVA